MTLEQASTVVEIAASIGVIVSLVFVGYQIKQNTGAMQRSEHNSTMAQWSAIRQAIATHRDLAELMTTGLHDERPLDAADQLRIEQFLAEYAWAAFHIWDRTKRGVFPDGTFELTGGMLLVGVLDTPRGSAWWNRAKHVGFIPAYVTDVDAMRQRAPVKN